MSESREYRSMVIMWLLIIFIAMWAYTEISEYIARDLFVEEVNNFMHKGDRFTQREGDALEERIRALEEEDE